MATIAPKNTRWSSLGRGLGSVVGGYYNQQARQERERAEQEKMANYLFNVRRAVSMGEDPSMVRPPEGLIRNTTDFLNLQSALKSMRPKEEDKKMEMVNAWVDGEQTKVPVDISSTETYEQSKQHYQKQGYDFTEPTEQAAEVTYISPASGKTATLPGGEARPEGWLTLEEYNKSLDAQKKRRELSQPIGAGSGGKPTDSQRRAEAFLTLRGLPKTTGNMASATLWEDKRSAGDAVLDGYYMKQQGGEWFVTPELARQNLLAREKYPDIYWENQRAGNPITPEAAANQAIRYAQEREKELVAEEEARMQRQQMQQRATESKKEGKSLTDHVMDSIDAYLNPKQKQEMESVGTWQGQSIEFPKDATMTYDQAMEYLQKEYNMPPDEADKFIREHQ